MTDTPTPVMLCPFIDGNEADHAGPVLIRRLNTRYVHDESNWLMSCRACFEDAWSQYDSQWDDSGQGSPFRHIAPDDIIESNTRNHNDH